MNRIIVLGGAGFLGLHLCELLKDNGLDVAVVDDCSRGRNQTSGVEYIRADVTRAGILEDILTPDDHVVNLAATVAGVIYNQAHNAEMFHSNLDVQAVPLAVAYKVGVERFLQVSSACIYAPGYTDPCVEENGMLGEPVQANNGYAWAKRMGERLVGWYVEQGLNAGIVRPSNLFGPHDYFDEKAHVIPAMIRRCFEDSELVFNGTGEEVREFLYVEDAAAGIYEVLRKGRRGEAYNLGTNGFTRISMQDLAVMVRDLCGMWAKPITFMPKHDAGDTVRWSDSGKIYRDTGWQHSTPLQVGLGYTIEWYKGAYDVA